MDYNNIRGVVNLLEYMRDNPKGLEFGDFDFDTNDAAKTLYREQKLHYDNASISREQALGADYVTPFWTPYRILLYNVG